MRGASIARFQSLDLTVQRRLDGLLHGEHAGFRLGPGSDPEELTAYRPGHDVRRIDWNVTARAREPQVWLTRAEHELDTWVLLDQTASMAFGTTTAEKADLALTIAAAAGLLTDAPGNRLGITTLAPAGQSWTRPRPGRATAQHLLRQEPGTRDGAATLGLADALTALAGRHRRPGLRIVVSDLVEPDGTIERPFRWEAPLRRLSARHDVIMVEIVDPRELELPDVGVVTLVDPESGRQREIQTASRRLRNAYAEAAARHREATAEAVKASRAGHLRLSTDGDWIGDLARFVRTRRRSRRRSASSRRIA